MSMTSDKGQDDCDTEQPVSVQGYLTSYKNNMGEIGLETKLCAKDTSYAIVGAMILVNVC